MGQILLARRMGRTRIIAETGAGQHGVATATVCALFGLKCVIYMGATDVERQQPNVFRMRLLGAEVHAVQSGAGTLKDAMNDALRDWVANVHDTYYLIGTVAGPHPYPAMVARLPVRDRRRIPGAAAGGRGQAAGCGGGLGRRRLQRHRHLPRLRRPTPAVQLIGVRSGQASGPRAVAVTRPPCTSRGRPGVLHGMRTYLLQDDEGQTLPRRTAISGRPGLPGRRA